MDVIDHVELFIMAFRVNQDVNAAGYVTLAKYIHGTVTEIENNIGYNYGRLANGFFVAYLQRVPDINEFDLAGYSITPEHRFKQPKDLNIGTLKKLAQQVMNSEGARNMVKIFPNTRHDPNLEPDKQYPYGKGGIPQWKLTSELPMHIFKEVPANYQGGVNINSY